MMMRDSWFRKVAKCLLLLTLTGVLWSLPFVRSETCNPNLNIRPVVDISASPENSRLPIGASITLTCTAEPRTIDAGYLDRWVNYIEWYDPQDNKVGAKCQQPSNMREYKRKLSCPLVLKNLTAEKFGRYTCQSGNGYIKHCTRKSFEIVIQGHGPELLGVPRNQSADVGANVTFSCTATGLPAPSISWIKNNDSFALQSNPRVTFNNNPLDGKTMQSQLFITGVKKEDFGEYQCEAKNNGGQNLSLPAFLTSKGPGAQIPEIVEGPKNQSVSIGSNAIFNCTAKGFPRPSIHWIKDNTSYPIQSNPRASVIQDDNNIRSQLLIKGVQKDDYGKYQCIAKNSAGGKESGVVFLIQRNFEMPEIVEDPKSQTYSIGSNHFFSCTATGLPRPNIIWIKNNDPNVTKTNPRLEIVSFLNDTKFHSVLLIKEATEEDAGTYQCFAKNSAGEKKSNVATLHIKEARLQETSALQISIPVTVSFIAATVLINGVLGLWWYIRCKRDTKPLGRRKVAKVHMSNGKCATVLIAQEAEEAPSLEDKLEEGLLQYPKNNGLHDM